jgi:hypothetical protein
MDVEGLLTNPNVRKFVDWVARKGSGLHRHHNEEAAMSFSVHSGQRPELAVRMTVRS